MEMESIFFIAGSTSLQNATLVPNKSSPGRAWETINLRPNGNVICPMSVGIVLRNLIKYLHLAGVIVHHSLL